ncbi:MAG: MFS transporter [Gammaproteobacteria bacterium]|nr:MAG: MFS transporter [Gammaproteobacteria bacterium]
MSGRVYYGWYVVAGIFLVLTISSGLGFYNLSVYMNVLAAEKGFSISSLSVAVSLFFIVGGVAGMTVAALLDRFDVRLVMVAGALLAGLALGSTGWAKSLWQVYALYVLFGLGNSAVSIVTSTTLVTRWFPGKERSVALSVASTGLSMGGVLITPLSARLFAELGVEAFMPWLGAAFFLVIAPVTVLVIRPHPIVVSGSGQTSPLTRGWLFGAAVRSRFFVLVTVAYVLCMASQVGGIAHLYNRAEGEVGYAVAATAVQVLTVMSILCRLLGGFLATRISIRSFALGNLLGQGAGLALIATADSPIGILIGAGVFGATVGNLLMLHPLLLAEAFGVRDYSRIFSLSNALTTIGVAGGPALLGFLYDFQGYEFAYLTAAFLSLGAGLVMLAAGAVPDGEVNH